MNSNLDKLDRLTSTSQSNWIEKSQNRKANEDRLDVSFKIALRIIRVLREHGMTQKDLAEKMNVTPQYISKIIKGQENLSIETITQVGNALSTNLFDAISSSSTVSNGNGIIEVGSIQITYTSYAAGCFENFSQLQATNTISEDYLTSGVYKKGTDCFEEKAA